jgi:hypothetical protein
MSERGLAVRTGGGGGGSPALHKRLRAEERGYRRLRPQGLALTAWGRQPGFLPCCSCVRDSHPQGRDAFGAGSSAAAPRGEGGQVWPRPGVSRT